MFEMKKKFALLILLLSFAINSQASLLNGTILYEDGTKLLISYNHNYHPIIGVGGSNGFILSTTDAVWSKQIEDKNILSIKPIFGTRIKGCIINSKSSIYTKRFGEISFCESTVRGKKQLNANFIIAKNDIKATGLVEKLLAAISDDDYGVDLIVSINDETTRDEFMKGVAKIVDALGVSSESDSTVKNEIAEAKKVLDNEEIKVKGYVGRNDDKQRVSIQCNGMIKSIDESSMKALVHFKENDLNFIDSDNKAIRDVVEGYNPENYIAVNGFALQDPANIQISNKRAKHIRDYLVFLDIPEDKIINGANAIINSRVDELKDTVSIYEIDCKKPFPAQVNNMEKSSKINIDSAGSDLVDKVMKCSGTLEYLDNNPPVQRLGNKNKVLSLSYSETVVEPSEAEKTQITEILKNLKDDESIAIQAFYNNNENKSVSLSRMLNLRRLISSSGLSTDRIESDIQNIDNKRPDLKNSVGIYKIRCEKP